MPGGVRRPRRVASAVLSVVLGKCARDIDPDSDLHSMRPEAPGRPERSFTLPDRYRLRRHIASGGMASVWCADDLVLDRSVAIKVLAERFAHDGIAVARFKREARAAARVSGHPHVVTVYDVGELAEPEQPPADATHTVGRAFIVMEYLAGGTVADAIRHESVRRPDALRWLREAASALDHAHAAGIVHRDIKPANFLLDRSRVLHVADFGIARMTTEETITTADQLFGTAAYLSPEQALGREATGASDRYALAVAAFELLAGERPFSAPHFSAQARQHIEEPPPAASEIDHSLPPAVDEVLFAGLAKQPDARPATAGEFVSTLDDALAGRPAAGPGNRPRRTAVRAPDPAAPAASTAAARRRPDPRPATPRPEAPRGGLRLGGSRIAALGALAAAALLLAGVAIAALQGGHHARARLADARSTPTRTTHTTTVHARTHRVVRHAPKPAATTTTSATTTAAPTPEQLQSTGHAELLSGDYGTAISTLKQAVAAAPSDSVTYAYALYDLGHAEVLSGDPQAAIPVLRARLKIPNQQSTVKVLLDQAIAQANGGTPTTPTTPQTTPTTPAPPAGQGAGGTGGAGLGAGAASGGGPGAGAGPPSGHGPGRHGQGQGNGNGNGNGNGQNADVGKRGHGRGAGHSPLEILTAAATG